MVSGICGEIIRQAQGRESVDSFWQKRFRPAALALSLCVLVHCLSSRGLAELRAGAAVVDVTPSRFPVFVNGGMTSRSADKVNTRLNARAIVLDDGRERLGIIVVDSCMMPRPLLDEAKRLASQRTQIKPDRMLISATHTHTAAAAMVVWAPTPIRRMCPTCAAG